MGWLVTTHYFRKGELITKGGCVVNSKVKRMTIIHELVCVTVIMRFFVTKDSKGTRLSSEFIVFYLPG